MILLAEENGSMFSGISDDGVVEGDDKQRHENGLTPMIGDIRNLKHFLQSEVDAAGEDGM